MTVAEQRAKTVELIRSRLRKNSYTQGEKRGYVFGYPENKAGDTKSAGYGDCSSTVRKCIKAAAGIDIGGNTSSQIDNRGKGQIVHTPGDGVPDESRYLPGDCLYFKGNAGHSLGVGHVEMYTGKNECIGHGSGTGPNVHDLKAYCKDRKSKGKELFMVIRWITGESEGFETLRKGSFGSAVTELQSMLLQLGYDLGAYGMDGDFGSATCQAVKAFQANVGINASGECDEVTWKVLKSKLIAVGDTDDKVAEGTVSESGGIEIKDGKWNLRTGPGTEYTVVKCAYGNEHYEEVVTDWIPVKVGDRVAWVSPKAVKGV